MSKKIRLPIKKTGKAVRRNKFGTVILSLIIIILGAFTALPFIYAIIQSFKPLNEIFIFPPKFYVKEPTTENYYMLTQLMQESLVPISRYVVNSIFVSVAATVLHVIVSSMAAFPLAKFKFPFQKAINSLIVTTLLFSGTVTTIPRFVLMSRVGLIDSHLALILPAICSSLGVFLMKQFMSQLPDALIEAARIDGASLSKILWKIVFPSVKPAWLTLTVFAFQGIWNNGGTEFIYNEKLKMLPTVLQQLSTSGISQVGVAAATAVLMMLPPILVFMLTQTSVMETMTQSGIKE